MSKYKLQTVYKTEDGQEHPSEEIARKHQMLLEAAKVVMSVEETGLRTTAVKQFVIDLNRLLEGGWNLTPPEHINVGDPS